MYFYKKDFISWLPVQKIMVIFLILNVVNIKNIKRIYENQKLYKNKVYIYVDSSQFLKSLVQHTWVFKSIQLFFRN